MLYPFSSKYTHAGSDFRFPTSDAFHFHFHLHFNFDLSSQCGDVHSTRRTAHGERRLMACADRLP
jgi:hypothetical protein